MSDYISRADAIEAVRKCKVQDIRFGNVTSNMMLVQKAEVIVALSALPSADAVDVAHDIPEYCSWSQTYTNMVQSALFSSADAEKGGDAEVNETKSPYMQQSRHDDGRMTKEEAIQVLTDIKRIRSDEIAKAIDMAIEALQKPKCYWCAYWNSETKGCKRNPSVQAWEEDDYCSYYVAIEALKGGDAMRNDRTYTQTPYMQQSPNNGADLISRAIDAIPIVDLTDGKTKLKAEDWVYDTTPSAVQGGDAEMQTIAKTPDYMQHSRHNDGKDLISRAEAINAVAEEWLSEASAESPYVNDDDTGAYKKLAEELFADIPSTDAVSREDTVTLNSPISIQAEMVAVVRCKDCRWWQDNNDGYPHANCHWCETETPDADDFCSLGERIEERSEQTEYKLPGHDEVMEALDKLTIKQGGNDHE